MPSVIFPKQSAALYGMEQFINGPVWQEDPSALDAVAKGIPATMTTKAVDATASVGSVSDTPNPAALTIKATVGTGEVGEVTEIPAPASLTVKAIAPSTTASAVGVTPSPAIMTFSAVAPTTIADGTVTTHPEIAVVSVVAVEAKAVAHVTNIDVEEGTLYP